MYLSWNNNSLKFLSLLLTATFISCENDIKVVNAIGNKDTILVESSQIDTTIYSDSAKVELIVIARWLIVTREINHTLKCLKVLKYILMIPLCM